MSMICIETFETQTGDHRTVARGELATLDDPRVVDYPDKWLPLFPSVIVYGPYPVTPAELKVGKDIEIPGVAGKLLLDVYALPIETWTQQARVAGVYGEEGGYIFLNDDAWPWEQPADTPSDYIEVGNSAGIHNIVPFNVQDGEYYGPPCLLKTQAEFCFTDDQQPDGAAGLSNLYFVIATPVAP